MWPRCLLSPSQSCCGLGGCAAIFSCFVFIWTKNIDVPKADDAASKGTPQVTL